MVTASLDEQRGEVIAALILERFGPPPVRKVPPLDPVRIERRRILLRALRE